MSHTQYRNHFAMLIPDRALGYAPDSAEGRFRNSMSNWEQTGDGAVHLSIDDVLAWDENFYTPRVGGATMVAQLQQRGTLANGDSIGYGRGLFIGTYRGVRRVEHSGDWIGYHAAYARFPAQHTSIVILCNSDGISPSTLGDRVADIVLDKSFTESKATAARDARDTSKVATALPVAALVGGYVAPSTGDIVRIRQADGKPSLGYAGQSFPLAATGPLEYSVNGLPVRITFEPGASKLAHAIWLHIGSSDSMHAERFVPDAPTAAELRSYAGRYHSPELGVTWNIKFANGRLVLDNVPSELMDITGTLEPAMKSTFTAGGGVLHFERNRSGRVTGMTLSASRMRGIIFDRVGP
jgi:hypothetical protein